MGVGRARLQCAGAHSATLSTTRLCLSSNPPPPPSLQVIAQQMQDRVTNERSASSSGASNDGGGDKSSSSSQTNSGSGPAAPAAAAPAPAAAKDQTFLCDEVPHVTSSKLKMSWQDAVDLMGQVGLDERSGFGVVQPGFVGVVQAGTQG